MNNASSLLIPRILGEGSLMLLDQCSGAQRNVFLYTIKLINCTHHNELIKSAITMLSINITLLLFHAIPVTVALYLSSITTNCSGSSLDVANYY